MINLLAIILFFAICLLVYLVGAIVFAKVINKILPFKGKYCDCYDKSEHENRMRFFTQIWPLSLAGVFIIYFTILPFRMANWAFKKFYKC